MYKIFKLSVNSIIWQTKQNSVALRNKLFFQVLFCFKIVFVFLQDILKQMFMTVATFWISSSFSERIVPIFVFANQWIYLYKCTYTFLCTLQYLVFTELINENYTSLFQFSYTLYLFLYAHVYLECMNLCVGYACMKEGLKRVWEPLELQLWVLWNACLVMWVLGPELQPAWLQKFSTAKPPLQPPAFTFKSLSLKKISRNFHVSSFLAWVYSCCLSLRQ